MSVSYSRSGSGVNGSAHHVFKSSRDLLEADLSRDAIFAQCKIVEPCRKPVRAAAKPRRTYRIQSSDVSVESFTTTSLNESALLGQEVKRKLFLNREIGMRPTGCRWSPIGLACAQNAALRSHDPRALPLLSDHAG